MSAPICFVDTETDGVHPKRHAWEIAIVRIEDGKPLVEWSAFIDIDLRTADPAGLAIGRFYERHPRGRVLSGRDQQIEGPLLNPWDAAEQVAHRTHGAHIVGAVPNFDTEVLDRLLRKHELIPAWHYHLIDVETLAVGYLAAHGRRFLPPYSSDDLTTALGLPAMPEDQRHTALGDAMWAASIYHRVTGPDAVRAPRRPFPEREVRQVLDEVATRVHRGEDPRLDDATSAIAWRLDQSQGASR